jgi:Homeodomain-like domain
MSRTGRPIPPLSLTSEERARLLVWVRLWKSAPALAERARIVLQCAQYRANKEVAIKLGISEHTVGIWRDRFVKRRLERLLWGPTLDAKSRHRRLERQAVRRVWRLALHPTRVDSFRTSTNPFLLEELRGVLGLYLHPPDRALVLCSDRGGLPAPNASHSPLSVRHSRTIRPGLERKCETGILLAALDKQLEATTSHLRHRRRSKKFSASLRKIDGALPEGLQAQVIFADYTTLNNPAVKRWLLCRPRFHLHFTSTADSWRELTEHVFCGPNERQHWCGAPRDKHELQACINRHLALSAGDLRSFIWTGHPVQNANEPTGKYGTTN